MVDPLDKVVSICFFKLKSNFTGPKFNKALPLYSASILWIKSKNYGNLSLNVWAYVRWLTNIRTSSKLTYFLRKTISYSKPFIIAWNGCFFCLICESGEGESSTRINDSGITFDMKFIVSTMVLACSFFYPINHVIDRNVVFINIFYEQVNHQNKLYLSLSLSVIGVLYLDFFSILNLFSPTSIVLLSFWLRSFVLSAGSTLFHFL